jgi:hypothetical protein
VTTTGNVATPWLDDAIVPTDVTVPAADAAVAVGVEVDAFAPEPVPFPPGRAPPKPAKPPAGPPPKPPPPEFVDVFELLVGVTVADWPTFRLPTVVVSTLRFTTNPELITSICAAVEEAAAVLLVFADADDADDAAELFEELAVLVRPDPVPVPVRFVPEAPDELSTSPGVRFTVATVPAMGDVSVAPLRSLVADTSPT